MRSTHALDVRRVVVVEEAIVGREIEVGVLGNPTRGVGAGRDRAGDEFYDYEDKYLDGRRATADPGAATRGRRRPRCARLAIDAFQALRCDGHGPRRLLLRDGGCRQRSRFLCNEVNTIPGFTPISMYPKLWIH